MADAGMIGGTAKGVAAGSARAAAPFADARWPVVALLWAILASAMAAKGFGGAIDAMSTDDAMRLVQVRDLIAGQGWFDLVQRRLDPPAGVAMHWSRLIDAPVALLLMGFETLFAPDTALRLTLTLWPALLLAPAMLAAASIANVIGGAGAGVLGALFVLLSPDVSNRFAPGMIDHHGAQIALTLVMLACTLKLERSAAAAVGAGATSAAMLAIGLETLPLVAVNAAFIGLRWAVTGLPAARGTAVFGLAFASATAIAYGITVPAARWETAVCDAMGAGHLLAAAVGGLGLSAATFAPGRGLTGRFAALSLVGAGALVAVALVAPDCLASPYGALPERLQTEWLAYVNEAQGLLAYIHAQPRKGLGLALPLLVATVAAIWVFRTAESEKRWSVGAALALFLTALAVSFWQVRGASFAAALAVAFLPAAVLRLSQGGAVPLRGLAALIALCPVTLWFVAGAAVAPFESAEAKTAVVAKEACPARDYRALDRLVPGLVLAPIDAGPYMLAHSRMSAIAAPYHRDVDGIEAWLDAFSGGAEAARAVAVTRRVAYVVACPADPSLHVFASAAPEGFSAALLAGRTPGWMTPVDLGPGVALRAWRVRF